MKNNSEIMRRIFNLFSRWGVLYFDSPCITYFFGNVGMYYLKSKTKFQLITLSET